MKFNYDTVADAVYLKVKEGKVDKTIKMKDRLLVDVNKKGDILGIEMLEFSLQQSVQNFMASVQSGVPVEITTATPASV
jgi:uncharacterized protein YuzE